MQLDKQRQLLEKLPEVKPYFYSSLYIRALFSPSAILVSIETEPSQDHISLVAKLMLDTWLDLCACTERRLTDDESAYLVIGFDSVLNCLRSHHRIQMKLVLHFNKYRNGIEHTLDALER
ncbi:hypothetical protein R3W88_004405 [Solanum pinnatisectum]|uniref:Uncharacterized protein n=1 Tax=Solanum pinnatisectum TaxID=50273 RepID=A0AAV9K9J0_9SOLN|nr:hypothetical protein R3W88_004405 [Solanum pinnatisectum]